LLDLLRPDSLTTAGRTLPELAPVFLKWFSLIRRRSENTCRVYQADLAAFLAFCAQAGLAHPDDVRVQHVEFFMGLLQEQRGLQAASVNRHLHALRSWWKWMQREEITVRNPAAQAFLLKQPKRLPKYLPVPEQDRLFRVLARDHSPTGVRDYALHATLGFGGLRCAELSPLRLIIGVLLLATGCVTPALTTYYRHPLTDEVKVCHRESYETNPAWGLVPFASIYIQHDSAHTFAPYYQCLKDAEGAGYEKEKK
jgi:hypothetical protein